MDAILNWCHAHGFKTKVVGHIVLWQTAIQTAEFNTDTNTIEWHEYEYFNRQK